MDWMNRPKPCDETLLAEAKANIDRCDFVGLFESLDESIRLACDRFGLTCESIPRINVTRNRPRVDDIDPSLVARIRERRRFDVALYEHAAAKFFGRERQHAAANLEANPPRAP
jgi:hypothetical protein